MYASAQRRDAPSSPAVTRPLSVLVLSLILVFTWSALPATASAQLDDGVHVDPDSAPAKEYALPLEAARAAGSDAREGSRPGNAASDAGPAAAFGSGITPKPAPSARSSRSSGASTDRSGARPDLGPGEKDPAATVSTQRAQAAGGNPVLYSLGGVLAVLVAGGLVALTLRRRQSPA